MVKKSKKNFFFSSQFLFVILYKISFLHVSGVFKIFKKADISRALIFLTNKVLFAWFFSSKLFFTMIAINFTAKLHHSISSFILNNTLFEFRQYWFTQFFQINVIKIILLKDIGNPIFWGWDKGNNNSNFSINSAESYVRCTYSIHYTDSKFPLVACVDCRIKFQKSDLEG